MSEAGPSTAHLVGRLRIIEARVRQAVARRRSEDPELDDRFRGLYISDADVDRIFASTSEQAWFEPPDADAAAFRAELEAQADLAEAAGADLRLRRLARSFSLDDADIELLLVALAPDLDPRFERLYAYLHDDVSRRRASAGLALELCGAPLASVERRRLGPTSALVADRLLTVEDDERPFLTRSLRVPDRVASHLLGDDTPDPMVEAVLVPSAVAEVGDAASLEKALAGGVTLVYLREPPGGAALSMAATALSHLGMPVLALDLARVGAQDDLNELVGRTSREARLVGAGIVAGPVEAITERGPGSAAVRALTECRSPVVLIGSQTWDPQWSRATALMLDALVPSAAQRARLWENALDGDTDGFDPVSATSQFRLNPEQVWKAAHSARLLADAKSEPLAPGHLQAGARAQNGAGLERLARRIAPKVEWEDLVLTHQGVTQLREIVARIRHRERVLDDWGMGRRSSKGHGVKVLFAGDSGTGKTISAEVVAHELGLDLYVIDLATVVDKYIGETEKNLDRIFSEADQVNGVLLFDEADALFGKRSDVKDAHDRYANVEVAYLLQRMESFDGLAILTTNLRSNLDDAFLRRLDAIVDFPMPEDDDRRRLWVQHMAPGLPQAGDIDLDFLARAFRISGGNIRNIVFGAAYLAASDNRPLGMVDLVRATEREYRKLGHLCLESEFGRYFGMLSLSGNGAP